MNYGDKIESQLYINYSLTYLASALIKWTHI